jgi:hypothetical protein
MDAARKRKIRKSETMKHVIIYVITPDRLGQTLHSEQEQNQVY